MSAGEYRFLQSPALDDETDYLAVRRPERLFAPGAAYHGEEVIRRLTAWSDAHGLPPIPPRGGAAAVHRMVIAINRVVEDASTRDSCSALALALASFSDDAAHSLTHVDAPSPHHGAFIGGARKIAQGFVNGAFDAIDLRVRERAKAEREALPAEELPF